MPNKYPNWTGAGAPSGDGVTEVSGEDANGFVVKVKNATSTPELSIETNVTGLLMGDGTGVSAATAEDVADILEGSELNLQTVVTQNFEGQDATIENVTIDSGTVQQPPVDEYGIVNLGYLESVLQAANATLTYTTNTNLLVANLPFNAITQINNNAGIAITLTVPSGYTYPTTGYGNTVNVFTLPARSSVALKRNETTIDIIGMSVPVGTILPTVLNRAQLRTTSSGGFVWFVTIAGNVNADSSILPNQTRTRVTANATTQTLPDLTQCWDFDTFTIQLDNEDALTATVTAVSGQSIMGGDFTITGAYNSASFKRFNDEKWTVV